MLSKIPQVYLGVAILVVVVGFYIFVNLPTSDPDSPRTLRRGILNVHDFGIPATRFVGVEMLRSPRTPELITEIEKLIEQNGLPTDIFRGLSVDMSIEEWQRLQFNNIAVTLHYFFGEYYEADPDNPGVPRNNNLEILWEASPLVGVSGIDARTLDRVRGTLAEFEPRRQSIRNELRNPLTIFFFIIPPDSLVPRTDIFRGAIVNAGASKYLADYALLEEYAIAQALIDGNIQEAMYALDNIFRIAYLASMLEDVGTRIDVAHVRLRAFDVMERVVLDPAFERQHMMILLERLLLREHQSWIPEYVIWFGDRANGLMMYQRLSIAWLNNTLEPGILREFERYLFNREIPMDVAARSFRIHQEADMIFYLQAMQRIIDASRQPVARRDAVLDEIDREIHARQNRFDDDGNTLEPFVAGFRLHHVEDFMVLFAQDQSALHRAIVAALHSLGQQNTDQYRDPFTDEPYAVEIDDEGFLSVSAMRLPRPFRVPVFGTSN